MPGHLTSESLWVTVLPGVVAFLYTASSSKLHYLCPGMPLDPVDHIINPGDDVQAFPTYLQVTGQAKLQPEHHVGRCMLVVSWVDTQ